jgi:hypothetical protein
LLALSDGVVNPCGEIGKLLIEVRITRADTGAVEEYALVGEMTREQLQAIADGSYPFDSSPQRSD